MTANERPTADPMPEPTPDRAVGELSDEVEQMWEDYWSSIVAPDGILDLGQVKRELFDYGNLLDNVPLVYCYVTGGLASKPFTLPSVITSLHDEYVAQRIEEALEEERAIAATERPADGTVNADVYHRAVTSVRTTLEGIATMTPEERKIASLQNQAVWIVVDLQANGLLAALSAASGEQSDGN